MPIAIQVCCVRRALLFRSSIWHCTASNVLLKLDASHHPVIVLRILEANCLSNRTSATVEVVKAWCDYCSSKLCLLFDLFCCSNLYTPGSCATLAALQMYFKQCHEPPWSEKTTWRSLMFGWNRSFAPFTIRFPGRYHCSLLKSFADWPNGTRLPCVHFPVQFCVPSS